MPFELSLTDSPTQRLAKIVATLGPASNTEPVFRELVRAGIEVHVFNHRTVAEILRMVGVLGGMIGCEAKAACLVAELVAGLAAVAARAAALMRRPRVYFEEWDEPQISAIAWVSELIGMAGGEDCFPELARESLGKQRIIADPLEVPRRRPDIILGSWCGKKFRPETVAARPGWSQIPAVANGYVGSRGVMNRSLWC